MVNLIPTAFNELPSTTNPLALAMVGFENRFFQSQASLDDIANAEGYAQAAAASAASIINVYAAGPGIRPVLSTSFAAAAANTAAIQIGRAHV